MRRNVASLLLLCLLLVSTAALGRPKYPLQPTDYRKKVSARVDAVWAKIDQKLANNDVTPARKKAMRRTFDEVAQGIWVEVAKASADGAITRDEALKIRALTDGLRGKFRSKLAADKKAEQAKADKAKAEQPKADQPKAEQPKADKAKADKAKADKAKADKAKADKPKADKAKADKAKAEQPKADQAKADEPKAEPKPPPGQQPDEPTEPRLTPGGPPP